MWTLDGVHIAFYSSKGNDASIEWMRSDGAGGVQVLVKGVEVTPYSMTPDSRRLAITRKIQSRNSNCGFCRWT